MNGRTATMLLQLVSIALGIVVWSVLARLIGNSLFLPSPSEIWSAAIELTFDGTLGTALFASGARIAAGWLLGVAVGIPVGILMGSFSIVKKLLEPYMEFFRFIPPVAFVSLAVIWLGPGEVSKVALIFYTTVFIVTMNTIAGVIATNPLRLRAARSLGANSLGVLRTITVPSAVPYMVTGARMAMGNSFLTIVSAEIVAAQQGLGVLIWQSRNYGRTEWVFVGIIALGLLGFAFDWAVRWASGRLLQRYGVSA